MLNSSGETQLADGQARPTAIRNVTGYVAGMAPVQPGPGHTVIPQPSYETAALIRQVQQL